MILLDQYTLANDATFQNRVRMAALAAAVAIHNEVVTQTTGQRDQFGKLVLGNPALYAQLLASAIASEDATIQTLATSPPVQALVTDLAIVNAISAVWNSFAVRI